MTTQELKYMRELATEMSAYLPKAEQWRAKELLNLVNRAIRELDQFALWMADTSRD